MSLFEKQRPAAVAASSAVAGKTARACDGCGRRRARWYCAADDAFLCQNCDSSVHSANPLARRHNRIRLKTATSSGAPDVDSDDSAPSWLRGFKRKARTPRPHQHAKTASEARTAHPTTVPELVETSLDETEDEEQQLIYCVPVFDPAFAEFRSPPPLDDSNAPSGNEAKPTMDLSECTPASTPTINTANRLAAFLPSDMEIAEFAANMESLLGGGLDVSDGSFSMEKLGLVNSIEDGVNYCLGDAGRLKTEQPDDTVGCPVELDIDMSRETLELDFNWTGSSTAEEEEFEEEKIMVATEQQQVTQKARLSLDYEAVIIAWSSHGSSPWTDGERPQINLDSCWHDCTVPGEAADEAVREEDTVRSCITCFCPCITFGQIAEIVDKGATSCGTSGALYALIMYVTCCQCLYSCFYRSKLRAQLGLREEPCADCLVHCCCETCSLCQMYRELNRRGYDMSIGWHANMERQGQPATIPPPVQGMSR
ncbi:unnamed protein product [Musa acuminata subsp. burmannicoides]